MDEPDSTNPPSAGEPPTTTFSPPTLRLQPRHASSFLPRRLAVLFAASFAAFSLTTWFLARMNNVADMPRDANTAEGVIRQQLDALTQGETRVAYALFSRAIAAKSRLRPSKKPFALTARCSVRHPSAKRARSGRLRAPRSSCALKLPAAIILFALHPDRNRRPLVDRRDALAR